MIGRLSGVLRERSSDGACIVDVNGVGYEVHVPLGALGRLTEDALAVLHVHTHVREDALTLYGFPSRGDRDAFRALLTVSSIGPKSALSIMSVLDAERLAVAVARGDKAAFKGIPGVGKKTVERLMLDLKDKLAAAASAARIKGGTAPTAASAPEGRLATVAAALVQMGYRPTEAERAVGELEDTEDRPVESLLREALAILS